MSRNINSWQEIFFKFYLQNDTILCEVRNIFGSRKNSQGRLLKELGLHLWYNINIFRLNDAASVDMVWVEMHCRKHCIVWGTCNATTMHTRPHQIVSNSSLFHSFNDFSFIRYFSLVFQQLWKFWPIIWTTSFIRMTWCFKGMRWKVGEPRLHRVISHFLLEAFLELHKLIYVEVLNEEGA